MENHTLSQTARVCRLWSPFAVEVIWSRTTATLFRSFKRSPALLGIIPLFLPWPENLQAQNMVKKRSTRATAAEIKKSSNEVISEDEIFLKIVRTYLSSFRHLTEFQKYIGPAGDGREKAASCRNQQSLQPFLDLRPLCALVGPWRSTQDPPLSPPRHCFLPHPTQPTLTTGRTVQPPTHAIHRNLTRKPRNGPIARYPAVTSD